MAEITLNTGRVPLTINFADRPESEVIYVNPTDKNLFVRFEAARKNLVKILSEFHEKSIKLDNSGLPENGEYTEEFEKMTKAIHNEIDTALASKVSDKIFKYCHPTTIIDGEYYITTFLEQFSQFVVDENKSSKAKIRSKAQEYFNRHGIKND